MPRGAHPLADAGHAKGELPEQTAVFPRGAKALSAFAGDRPRRRRWPDADQRGQRAIGGNRAGRPARRWHRPSCGIPRRNADSAPRRRWQCSASCLEHSLPQASQTSAHKRQISAAKCDPRLIKRTASEQTSAQSRSSRMHSAMCWASGSLRQEAAQCSQTATHLPHASMQALNCWQDMFVAPCEGNAKRQGSHFGPPRHRRRFWIFCQSSASNFHTPRRRWAFG